MNRSCKSFFLLPVAVLLLSGCQRVMASDHSNGALTINQEAENYQQIISLTQRIETAQADTTPISSTITQATLFPQAGEGYGTRIIKKTTTEPVKWDLYASQEGAYQQKNNGEWSSSATPDPIFAALEVVPYETFAELAELFLMKGQLHESHQEYIISYAGSDSELNGRITSLLNQFPATDSSYEARIAISKEDHRVTSLDLCIESQQQDGKVYCQEIQAAFQRFNRNTLSAKPER